MEEQKKALEINAAAKPGGNLLDWRPAQERFAQTMGARYGARRNGGYWDADHVIPVSRGGGECGLDNYRTLCILCHKKETARLKKEKAQEKKSRPPA